MSHDRFRAAVIAAAFLISVLVFLRMPATARPTVVPLIQRLVVAFFLPATALAVLFILKRVAAKEPRRENYAKFRGTFELLLDITVVVLFGLQLLLHGWLIVFHRLDSTPGLGLVPTTLVGLALVIVGNVLPRIRPNSAVGIRTPWTLRDERTWAGVHRAGGYLIMGLGLAFLAVTFIDFHKVWWVVVPGLILTLAGLPLLSFLLWRFRRI